MKPTAPSDGSSPVSKIKKYAGPSTHKAILKKIYEELKAEGKEVPPHYIMMVVVRFFSSKGIFYYTRNFISFRVKNLGVFKRVRYVKPKDGIYKKRVYKKKKKVKKYVTPTFKKHYRSYKTNNRRRIRNGLEPISLKRYVYINQLNHYSKKMYALEKKELNS